MSPYFPRDGDKADPERIAKVLQHVLIRRRRKDILHHYPGTTLNGRPVSFPEPKLSNREYSLDHVYKKAGGLKYVTDLLNKYQATRYKPAEYLTDEGKVLPQYANIVQSHRGNLAGIMTTNLWKRLESSIPAFRSTLEVLMESNQKFRSVILNGGVSQDEGEQDSEEALTVDLPSGEELDADELDRDEEYIQIKDQSYPAQDFDCLRWLRDLDRDGAILARIAESLKDVQASDDAKLHELKSFIKSPGVTGEKMLVFTESRVTATYLLRELQADNPSINIDLLVGGDSRTANKIARFSPKSNGRPDMPESEQTRILIATDVIAEGQNLQDCNRVFSYDLHWNPVTLIQRYGQVDRITTEHEEVYLHNMMPDPVVEDTIGIRRTVANRVQAFHDLIGLDSAILETGERVNPNSIYSIYDGEMPEEQDSITDSLAVAQEANALLNRIRREHPELWQRLWLMPDGLRAAMARDSHPTTGATIALVARGDAKQGYAVKSSGTVTELTQAELVRQLECEPGTPATPLPPDSNRRVSRAAAAFAEKLAPKPVALAPRRRDSQVTRYINTQLSQLRLEAQADLAYLQRLEEMRAAFNAELPVTVNDRIRALMRENADEQTLVLALAGMLEELPKAHDTSSPEPKADGSIRVVCSMGITSPP